MRHIGSAYAASDVYDYATQGPNEEVGVLAKLTHFSSEFV